jgi:hypothetical protein
MSPNARDLHPTDEDLSVGTPDLGHPLIARMGMIFEVWGLIGYS